MGTCQTQVPDILSVEELYPLIFSQILRLYFTFYYFVFYNFSSQWELNVLNELVYDLIWTFVHSVFCL